MFLYLKIPVEVLSGCKRLYQMHQNWRKAHKPREILTVGKVLLLFSMRLIMPFVHKYTYTDKIPCLKKLIEVWFTALLLPAVPLASCFEFSETSSFSSSYLAENLFGSETSLQNTSSIFKTPQVSSKPTMLFWEAVPLFSSSNDIWQCAHSEMSTIEVVPISRISPGLRCLPARGTGVSGVVSTRHRFILQCWSHTHMHAFQPKLAHSELSLRQKRHKRMHICTKDKDDSLCSVETSFKTSDFDQLFGQALSQIKQDTRYLLTP